MRNRVWTIILLLVLLWPLISTRIQIRDRDVSYLPESDPKRTRFMRDGRVFVCPLRGLHPECNEEGDVIKFCCFSPLGSVRTTEQNRRPGVQIAKYFVSWQDLLNDCSELETWWKDSMRMLIDTYMY